MLDVRGSDTQCYDSQSYCRQTQTRQQKQKQKQTQTHSKLRVRRWALWVLLLVWPDPRWMICGMLVLFMASGRIGCSVQAMLCLDILYTVLRGGQIPTICLGSQSQAQGRGRGRGRSSRV